MPSTITGVAQALLLMNEEVFMVAARNLLENALRHSPTGGIVRWSVATGPAEGIIAIEDDGPGIPEDELALVCQRIFRGRHKSGPGSGLGLAIVDLALQQAQARLRLANRPGGGLRAEIVVSGARLSPRRRRGRSDGRKRVKGWWAWQDSNLRHRYGLFLRLEGIEHKRTGSTARGLQRHRRAPAPHVPRGALSRRGPQDTARDHRGDAGRARPAPRRVQYQATIPGLRHERPHARRSPEARTLQEFNLIVARQMYNQSKNREVALRLYIPAASSAEM